MHVFIHIIKDKFFYDVKFKNKINNTYNTTVEHK